jgi:hypothetical protein
MRSAILAVVVAAVMLTAGVAMAVDTPNHAGLVEYRVISTEPVALDEVMSVFMPGLGQGGKVETLVPQTTGVGLIQRWNTHLPGLTWKTALQPGATIWLPAKWRMWGVQGILEPAKVPQMNWNPASVDGRQFWGMVFMFLLAVGGVILAVAAIRQFLQGTSSFPR